MCFRNLQIQIVSLHSQLSDFFYKSRFALKPFVTYADARSCVRHHLIDFGLAQLDLKKRIVLRAP